MAIIVQDDFNRVDDPTGLGIATTGQTWNQVLGPAGSLSIQSDTAVWTWHDGDVAARAVLETGFTDAITSVTLVNPSVMDQNYAEGYGLICRYVDGNNYWRLVYYKFPGPDNRLRLERTYLGATTTVIDVVMPVPSTDNMIIKVAYCARNFEIFVNGVSEGTFDDSANPFNYGTQCGLYTSSGVDFGFVAPLKWDDFLVETNGTCSPTYNCTAGACVDPGDGTGTYATLAECLSGCSVSASYNCIAQTCIDPGDGSGSFTTLTDCLNSGCGGGITGVTTQRFDQGIGSSWYIVLPVIDSGEELRSKVLKAVREIGKVTGASIQVYGYDVEDPITVSDLEDGTNSSTGLLGLSSTTQVTQSPRVQINIPNAVLHTVRIAGDDTGESTRDTIHEIVMEQAEQGVRR